MIAHLIPYGRQSISQADVKAITDVLWSDFLTQGPVVPKFEQAVATYCQAKHGIAVNSATSALHIACLAVGLKSGDWLWTSPNTFVASANCGRYCGANIDFVDVDPKTYNMSVDALQAKLERAEKENCLPKVVMPVHFAGQSCNMEAIHKLSQRYGFRVIEDASHAVGGFYKQGPIGNCRYSDVTVFSFHAVKIITTGEGGMALTNNKNLANCMARLRTHGVTRDKDEMRVISPGPWYYEQVELGLNYRMTDIAAALGTSQLHRMDTFIARRREIVTSYNETLSALPLILPWQHPDTASSWHLYVVQLDLYRTNVDRASLFNQLRGVGIGVNVHYIPLHIQPYYQELGFKEGDYPEAEGYYSRALSLPIYASLSKAYQERIISVLRKYLA